MTSRRLVSVIWIHNASSAVLLELLDFKTIEELLNDIQKPLKQDTTCISGTKAAVKTKLIKASSFFYASQEWQYFKMMK